MATISNIHRLVGKEIFKSADEPILDVEDEEIRAMIAITLGCDVIPGSGISGVGSKILVDLFAKFKVDRVDKKSALKEWMTEKMNVDCDVIDAYIGTFLYEPCNI